MSEIGSSIVPPTPSPHRAPFSPWVYLAISVVISFLPLGVAVVGGGELIRDFFFSLYDDLSVIQPFSLIPIYFDQLSGCDYLPGSGDHTCTPWRFVNPVRLLGALFQTVGVVVDTAGALGIVLLVLAMIIGFFLTLAGLVAVFKARESNMALALLAAFLTPFVASLIALVMQGVAMLLSIFIAYIVVAFLWAGTFLKKGWDFYQKAKEIKERADFMEATHARQSQSRSVPPASP